MTTICSITTLCLVDLIFDLNPLLLSVKSLSLSPSFNHLRIPTISHYTYLKLYQTQENMARNKHSRRSQASRKEASPPSSATTQSPNTTVNQETCLSYVDSLLSEAERSKRYERVAAQQAQIAQVDGNPDYQEKLKDLEKKTPGMVHRSPQFGTNDLD